MILKRPIFFKESKIAIGLIFTLFLFSVSFFSQSSDEFKSPWTKSETPIIIDAFYKNSIDWKKMKSDKKVVGILHKATQGTTFTDSEYINRRKIAKEKGYKWGSYHLLEKGNALKQAKYYLEKVGKNNQDEIMALDVECTENSLCEVEKFKVSAEEIKTFIKYIKQETGRYPIFYANNSVVKDLTKNYPNDELLIKCPLWYARFKKEVTDFPQGIWKTYTFWQFSSEINCKDGEECLYRVPGTMSDMDVNVYNGTIKELRKNWSKIGK